MALPISTIKTAMEGRLGSISDVTDAMLIRWADDLNQRLYRSCYMVDPARYITSQSYTVSTSPSTQALPAFESAKEFDCGFYELDANGNKVGGLVPVGYGSLHKGYNVIGDNVTFTGFNSETTVIFRYIPTLAALTTTSSNFIVPDRYQELVVWGMIALYYAAFKDPERGNADSEFNRLLGEFERGLSRFSQVYTLQTF